MDRPQKDKANPTNFTASVDDVHESVTVPYSQRAAANKAKTDALKGRGKPLGGAPPIPEGKLAPLAMPQPDFGEEEEPPPINQEEARQQKRIQGVGSAYAVNQRLATGEHKEPVSIAAAKSNPTSHKLSPETVEAMRQMDTAVKESAGEDQAAQTPEPPKPPPMEDPIPTEEEEKQKLEESDKELERQFPMDVDGIAAVRNSLFSEERRKIIEARLDKLDIADMVMTKEIQQNIPVVPGKFEVSLRTLSQRENLFCLQYVYEFPGSDAYTRELHNTAKLVCSLTGINGASLPDHRNNVGKHDEEVDRKKFEVKMGHITSFPVHLIGDVSVQLIWFNARVNELFNMGNLKNG